MFNPQPKQEKRPPKAPKPLKRSPLKPKAYQIKPVSDRRAKQNREYSKVRKEYLSQNPGCKVCGRPATEVHHRAGRVESKLTDTAYFLAVCRTCHQKIELNPTWAKQLGYSLNRT